jgi:hypothetical protein
MSMKHWRSKIHGLLTFRPRASNRKGHTLSMFFTFTTNCFSARQIFSLSFFLKQCAVCFFSSNFHRPVSDFVFNRRKNVFKSKVFGLVLEGPVNCRTTFHSTAFFVWLFWLFRFPLWRSFPSSIGIIPFSNGQTKSQNEKPSRSKP